MTMSKVGTNYATMTGNTVHNITNFGKRDSLLQENETLAEL